MKTRKRSLKYFHYRECDAFAEYLHQQSLKGWHFKEWRLGLVFEQGEPEDIEYTVEVFPKGSEQDLRPGEDTKEYAEYCEAAGWKLVDAHGKFCIFRKLRKDAVPIVESEERFENIRKAELAWWGNRSLMAILLAPIYFFEFWKLNFEVWIFTDVMLLFLALFLILAIGAICEGIQLAVWCKGKRRKLAKGERIHYGNCGTVGIRRIIFSIAMLGFAIIGIEQQSWVAISLVVTIALLGMVSGIVSIWRPLSTENTIFTLIAVLGIFIVMMGATFSHFNQEQPIQEISDNHVVEERMAGIFGKGEWGVITWPYEVLDYKLYHSPHTWITDEIWRQEYDYLKEGRDCKEIWDAEAAYVIGDSGFYWYCIRFAEDVVTLHVDAEQELDAEEILKLKEQLQIP